MSVCRACDFKSFSNVTGAEECEQCPAHSQRLPRIVHGDPSSSLGTIQEDCLCNEGFYRDETAGECTACSLDALCTGGEALPRPLPGYWHDASTPKRALSEKLLKSCSPGASRTIICPGVKLGTAESQCYESRAAFEACAVDAIWATSFPGGARSGDGSAVSAKVVNSSICRPGHGGVRCATCLPNYYPTSDGLCRSCRAGHYKLHELGLVKTLVILILVRIAIALTLIGILRKYIYTPAPDKLGRFHALWPQIQIIATIAWTLGRGSSEKQVLFLSKMLSVFVHFPINPFQSPMAWNCIMMDYDYFTDVIVCTCFPILVMAVLLFMDSIRKCDGNRSAKLAPSVSKKELLRGGTEAKTKTRTWMYRFYLYTFLVYQPISYKLLSVFNCEHFENGKTWLLVDSSISCDTPTYKTFVVYTSLMVLAIPVGVPLLYFVVVYKKQGRRLAKCSDDHDCIDKSTFVHLNFVIGHYKPEFWWYESVDCLRRLLYTVLLTLTPCDAWRSVATHSVAIVTHYLLRELCPFLHPSDAAISDISNLMLVIVCIIVLFDSVIMADMEEEDGVDHISDASEAFAFSVVVLAFAGFIIITAYISVRTGKTLLETEASLLEFQLKEYEIQLTVSEMQADLDRFVRAQHRPESPRRSFIISHSSGRSPEREAALIVRPSFRDSGDEAKVRQQYRITKLPSIDQHYSAGVEEKKVNDDDNGKSNIFAPKPVWGSPDATILETPKTSPQDKGGILAGREPNTPRKSATPPRSLQRRVSEAAVRAFDRAPSPLSSLGASWSKGVALDRKMPFPCYVISVKNLRTMSRVGPNPSEYHEDIFEKLEILTFKSRSPARSHTFFVSHNWDSKEHPDNEQATKLRWLQGLHKHLNIPETTDLWLWWDILSVPQKNERNKNLAIESINAYATLCSRFLPIVRDANEWEEMYGSDEGSDHRAMRGSLQAYQNRAWCRFELLAALCPKQTKEEDRLSWRHGPANLRFRYHHNPDDSGCGERLSARHLLDPREGEIDHSEDMEILSNLLVDLGSAYDRYERSGSHAWDLTIDVKKRPRWLKMLGGAPRDESGATSAAASPMTVLEMAEV